MNQYTVRAVEPQLDGTEDSFGPETAEAMKLPFDYGWDHWGIYQGELKIAPFDDFELADSTCSALNNISLLGAAA